MPPKKKKPSNEKKSTISKAEKQEIEAYVPEIQSSKLEYRKCIDYVYLNHWADWKKPRNSKEIKYKVKPRSYFLQKQFDRFNVEILEETDTFYRLKLNDSCSRVEEFTIYISGGGIDKIYGNPFNTKGGLDAFVSALTIGLHWYYNQMDGKK